MPRLLQYANEQDCPVVLAFDSINLKLESRSESGIVTLEQKIRVETINGETVSTFEPTNEQLLAQAEAISGSPDQVHRRMTFIGDIPREYKWTIPHAEKQEFGGFGEQRMTYRNWRKVIESEGSTGHAGPTSEPNLPRRKAKGD